MRLYSYNYFIRLKDGPDIKISTQVQVGLPLEIKDQETGGKGVLRSYNKIK